MSQAPTVTRAERHAGALLAEFPGDPDQFNFEALHPATQAMIRRRLAEERNPHRCDCCGQIRG